MDGLTALAFIASIGVNTHIPYTDGGYSNLQNVEADIRYLGIDNARDGISDGQAGSAPLASFIQLAAAGVHFTIGAETSGVMNDQSLLQTLGLIDRLEIAVPGSITAVEGANEINNFPLSFDGVGGLQGAIDMQRVVYRHVHDDPRLTNVSVDYFTGYGAGNFGPGPSPLSQPGLADYDTQHPYPNQAQPPAGWIDPQNVLPNEPDKTGPVVYTETGYTTNGGHNGGVNQDVQAKYELDLLCDAARFGVSRVYLYDLMDAYPPGSRQGDDGFGLFDDMNAPKTAATAIHNLTSILKAHAQDMNGSATEPVQFTLAGPMSPMTLTLQKSPDVSDILIWLEPEIWDEAAGHEINVAPVSETLRFSARYAKIAVFDPLVSDKASMVARAADKAVVNVTDHPVIIEITR